MNFLITNLVEVPCLRRQIWRRASRQISMSDKVFSWVDNGTDSQTSANSMRCRGTETEGHVGGPSFRAHQGMHLSCQVPENVTPNGELSLCEDLSDPALLPCFLKRLYQNLHDAKLALLHDLHDFKIMLLPISRFFWLALTELVPQPWLLQKWETWKHTA